MKPSPDVEANGLRAYEQVRAFERLRTWRLPVTLALFPTLAAATTIALACTGHGQFAVGDAAVTTLLAWLAMHQWTHLRRRHDANVKLLRALEAEFGDALPWVQMEQHFAKLADLREDLAREG